MFTDTHAHLYWDSFQADFDQIIKRCLENEVTTLINVGVDIELSKKALLQITEQFKKYPQINPYSTIGIHPHEAVKYTTQKSIAEGILELEKLFNSQPSKVVAVGECGLDFFFDNNPDPNSTNLSEDEQKKLQVKLFESQIDLAKKLNLPLIVHVRDDRSKDSENSECWDLALEMINTHPAILHCYSGLIKTTKRVLQMPNVLVSFAATLTYPKNDYLREAVKLLPLEKIVLETDCPFLPPQTKRGQRNEPANILETAQIIADIKQVHLDKVATQTSLNARKIFALKG